MEKIHLEEGVGFGDKGDKGDKDSSSMKRYLKTLHLSSIWMDRAEGVEIGKGLILWLIWILHLWRV